MLIDTVRSERSYDCLPNFTAADCLRLLGVGRNQFIEVVNTYKSFLTTAGTAEKDDLHEILFEILPDAPVLTISYEPWYIIHVGAIFMEDIENSSSAERLLIDRIIDSERAPANSHHRGGIVVANADIDVVRRLYSRGLIYLEVPVGKTDRFDIPTLEGFVMNRVNGDTRENLLYKIFISIDSNTTINELADCLKVDAELVSQAASIFCRLGFAFKKVNPIAVNPPQNPCSDLHQDLNTSSHLSPDVSPAVSVLSSPATTGYKKLALIVDSTVIAYLMMGNLSDGLKPHAVTLFEVGKLSDDALSAFLNELDNLSSIDEGEAKMYYEHALNLREAIHFLRSQAYSDITDFQDVDLIRGGSLLTLECDVRIRFLQKKYSMIISLSPMTCEDRLASSVLWHGHIGPPIPETNSPWFPLYIVYLAAHQDPQGTSAHLDEQVLPLILLTRGSRLYRLPDCFKASSDFQITAWEHNPVTVPAGSLLTYTNDMTLLSPVLIQSIDAFQPSGKKLDERYIPLPLSRELISQANHDRLPKFLANLIHQLDLSALTGYLKVLTLPSNQSYSDGQSCANATCNETKDNGASIFDSVNSSSCQFVVLSDKELLDLVSRQQPIYLISLHLGLPIFSGELLHAVCQRIVDPVNGHMLTAAQRSRLDKANKRLVAGLSQFIRLACFHCLWPKATSRRVLGGVSKTLGGQSLPASGTGTYSAGSLLSDQASTMLDSSQTTVTLPSTSTGSWSLPTRNLVFAQGNLTDFV